MNRNVFLPLIALVAFMPSAQCQTTGHESLEGIWLPLLTSPEGIDLRYQMELTAHGWQIQFKNFSRQPLHFGFYLNGVQDSNQSAHNGRIHLQPGKVGAPFIHWVGVAPTVLPEVRLVNIRIGEDEGAFWRD